MPPITSARSAGGELRLRERVDVAPGGQQRVVRAEEQAVRTAEVDDRAVRRRGEEERAGGGVEPEPAAQLGHLRHVRVERKSAAEVRADQAQAEGAAAQSAATCPGVAVPLPG